LNSKAVKVSEYLARFDSLISKLAASHSVESLAPRVHVIKPLHLSSAKDRNAARLERDVVLSMCGLIHGVEVAGLAILVELLELVTRGELALEAPLGLALGNIPAALHGVRFVERDLNRSFGRADTKTAEDRRADELEGLFSRSMWLLDIHQVKLPIDRPFWIFPFTRRGYDFARAVAPDVSLITHWGRSFSQDGQCSDEWLNNSGGAGVTIELGQNGFDRGQIAHGLRVCIRAIQVATKMAKGGGIEKSTTEKHAPLYTWGEIVPYPETGEPVLTPGWHNFKIAGAGETLGVFKGQPIKASVTGPVLFPKYPDPQADGSYASERPAAELVRILKEISETDLPSK